MSHTTVSRMYHWVTLALGLSLALGCGGGPDEDFTGLWAGPVLVTADNGNTLSYIGSLTVRVDGDDVVVSGFCPTGSGSVRMLGNRDEASFSGIALACPLSNAQCSSGTLVYDSGDLRLKNDTLFAAGTGSISACGSFARITTTFTGVRQ